MVYHLPGYRFSPTDDELVMFYLKRKIMGKKLLTRPIAEVDIYNYHPRDLPGKSSSTTNDLVWYFFCPSHIQNTSSRRRSRATDGGFWKTTGVDKPVYHDSRIVGKRKSLVFHNGRAPKAERTDWVIHEFRLEDPLADPNFSQNSYVICKLFEKSGPGPKIAEKHGAPFKEEDWDDDDNVGIDNNSADLISSVSSSERHHDRDRDHDLQSSFHPKDSINIGNNQNSLNSFQFGPQEPPAVLGIERTLFHIDSEIPVPILSQEPDQLNQSSLQNPAFDLMDSQTEGGNQYTPNGFCGPVELSNYLNTSRSLLYTDSALPVPVLYPELQNNHSSLQNPSFYPMDSRTAGNYNSTNSFNFGSLDLSNYLGTEIHVDSSVPDPILYPELQHDQSFHQNIDASENYLDDHDLDMLLYDDPQTFGDCFTSNMDNFFTIENPLDCKEQKLTSGFHIENETAMHQNLMETSSYIEMNDLQHLMGNFYSEFTPPPIPTAVSYASRTYDEQHIRNNHSRPFTTGASSSLSNINISEKAMTNGMNTTAGALMFQPKGYNK